MFFRLRRALLRGKAAGSDPMSEQECTPKLQGSMHPLQDRDGARRDELLEVKAAWEQEAAIKESEQKYRDLADMLPQPVFEADLSGRLTYANRAAFDSFRYIRQDWERGVHVLDTVASDHRDRAKRNLSETMKGKKSDGNEYLMLRKDGTTFPGLVFSSPVVRAGHVVGARGVIIDLSERKQIEAALRREKEFAENLIQAAPTIVLVLDQEGRIVRTNTYLEKLTGYQLEEVAGKNWFTLFLPESERDDLWALFQCMTVQQDATTRTNSILTKDGRRRDIEWSNRTLRSDRGELLGVLAIGHDITELRKAQEQALQSERLAAIGEMVAGLAHESGNALQRTQSCLEMLAIKVQDRPDALNLVDRIQYAQDRLQRLYREVQHYAGPMIFRRESVRIRDVIQQAWADVEDDRLGKITRIRGDCFLAEDVCSVDADALERVFQNIFTNSLAAGTDPIEITVTRNDAVIDRHPAVEIVVRDNGRGMDAEQRQRIFEPFYTTKTRGTGLGMSISKRIVEGHGGQIRVGQHCAIGSEIVVTLPKE
jgi:PAS domain S-box-containing protein